MSPTPKHLSYLPLGGSKHSEWKNSKSRGGYSNGQGKTIKLIVLGQASVGKTALTVRFITRRFIWEYDPTLEMIYKHSIFIGPTGDKPLDQQIDLEILDTAGQEQYSEEKLRWADAFIIVYSVTDRCSFEEVMRLKFLCSRAKRNCNYEPAIMIVGNKHDLQYDRIVTRSEGEDLASTLGCRFLDISVRESLEDSKRVFMTVCNEHRERRKTGAATSPKFLGRRRSPQTTNVDLDLNPPPPRERSTSFLGLPDYWHHSRYMPTGSSDAINGEEDECHS